LSEVKDDGRQVEGLYEQTKCASIDLLKYEDIRGDRSYTVWYQALPNLLVMKRL
jgi:hypothetical protein